MLIPVVLSGGAGTRLWPLSRELYPKQLLALAGGERTMLQDTVARLEGLPELAAPVVVCNEAHRFMVAEQLRQQGVAAPSIILEPVGRNTAPAIALAAHAALASAPDPLLLVLPADHVIRETAPFLAAVMAALPAAQAGRLVTFGVVARQPETGYGYIRRSAGEGPVYPIASFVEKPDAARAREFVASGDYFWNSGMFLFRARRYLAELQHHAPEIASACAAAWAAATRDLDFIRCPWGKQ